MFRATRPSSTRIVPWVHLRNREDFDEIYKFPDAQRFPLERVYQDGRDLAGQLSYLLSEFNLVSEYPTFRSFVDAVDQYVSEVPPELEKTLSKAAAVLLQLENAPWAVKEMISLTRKQLGMTTALIAWVRLARDSTLYRQEADLPAPTPNLRARAIAAWDRHGSQIIVGIVVTIVGGLVLAAIL